MKKYINEQKVLAGALKDINQFLTNHRNQFANISTAIFSINNILSKGGYRLANDDGTHHNAVYYGDSGSADITIIDSGGNIIGTKMQLNWKMMETGLGWKIAVKLIKV